jgi:hypothetical protein
VNEETLESLRVLLTSLSGEPKDRGTVIIPYDWHW